MVKTKLLTPIASPARPAPAGTAPIIRACGGTGVPAGLLPASVQLPESDSSPGQRHPPQAVQAPKAHSSQSWHPALPEGPLPAPLTLPGHCPTSPSAPLSLTLCPSPHPSPPQHCSACWCSVRPRSWPASHREQLLVAHPNPQAANSQEHGVVCKLRKRGGRKPLDRKLQPLGSTPL